MLEHKWEVIKEDDAYYVVRKDKYIYLDSAGVETIFPRPFFTLDDAELTLERNQQMTNPQPEKLPQVDWSQPIQTDENPPRKARLICKDKLSKDGKYDHIVLVENKNGEEVVWYCDKNGRGQAYLNDIINVPAKVPYGREDWERLTRVRDRGIQTRSYLVGNITNNTVVIGGSLYDIDKATPLFLTMDGQELYK